MEGERAFLLDFDHTLFDTDRFFWVDLCAAFARFAIDAKAWEESYGAVWPTGYSLQKHLEHLAREGQVGSSVIVALQQVLRERFADLRAYLFADAEPFLKRLQAERIPCFLLSFGDPAWQAYKVRGARIADLFREVFFTGRGQAKVEAVEALAPRFGRLFVVDNDPRELDRVKASRPEVETFWITRVPAEALSDADPALRQRFREARYYATLPAEFPHRRCRSLDEVAW
jgi:phosphoglycolate phosphatase-like HAD superfamily hydrolase